ncbi:MAG: hypothetical protein H7281_04920 [Bacteriovorax sp.]|nr:hypothetical protein [Bacteriovorax sp.]
MKFLIFMLVSISSLTLSLQAFAFVVPNSSNTPGVLCSPTDPNFRGYDYPEHIARCNRNVGNEEKLKIAAAYGNIPQGQWPQYEFDHMIPLCAGGSDDIGNLWPQPIAEAHQKDVLENDICLAMKAGTMTQAQAVQKVRNWFKGLAIQLISLKEVTNDFSVISCQTKNLTILKFSLAGNNQITKISVNLKDKDGEHEAIKVNKTISGKEITKAKSPLLIGLVRYVLNEKSKDHFEIFLPQNVGVDNSKFNGFLKIGFEDNYPSLTSFECE